MKTNPAVPFIEIGAVLLAVMLWPNMKGLLRYSAEGKTRGDLGTLRMAIIDYQKMHGVLPTRLSEPDFHVPLLRLFDTPHNASNAVIVRANHEIQDSGHWQYSNDPHLPKWGHLIIDCSHQDSHGMAWSAN